MASSDVRPAGKARDGWYQSNGAKLSAELDENLELVPERIDDHSLPLSGARVVISP